MTVTTPPDPTRPVEPWYLDNETNEVKAVRHAEFWQRLRGNKVACNLCYRDCVLKPGEAGWCKIRRNVNGTLQIPEHGVIANAQPNVDHFSYWRNHARTCWISGISCTSGCSFCTSTNLALAPERMPWGPNGPYGPGKTGGWAYYRAILHPEAVIDLAWQWECSGIYFGANEPLLTYEFTYDTARLAKAAGLTVNIDTNGFSSPEAIGHLAPFVDMVYLGVKGHADPGFYAKRMRAPGAVPHVLAAAKAWKDAGVVLGISDVIPPPHWVSEEDAIDQMRRFYSWIVEELGELTPLEVRGMIRPQHEYAEGEQYQPLLPRDAGYADRRALVDRWHLAERIAEECGLRYWYSHEYREIRCHHCGGVLVGRIGWVNFDLHVDPDGTCHHCGGATPVHGISREEYDQIQREERAQRDAV